MTCPDKVFLESFARDPDVALDLDPAFGIHLSQCASCRSFLDAAGQSRQSLQISELLTVGEPNPMQLPCIDGYTIQEFIGAGASGTVYKAEQIGSGLEVAIKIVHGLTADQWKRIEIERQTLIQCDHPNIVQLLDYGRSRESCFFVTRWAEQSLAKVLQESLIIDLKDAVNWTIQIANAIGHLHGLGIVHRDLKPSNVLLTSNKVPKLIDFGIAKDLNANSTLTGLNTPLGTPGYMAPEQAGKSDLSVGFRTDVYGLGAVLYTLITGRPPFVGSDSVQVISQVLEEAPIAPRKLRPETPKDLETICLKCLEKRPSDRYDSAHSLSEDLRRLLDGVPILAKPTTKSVLVWRSLVKHRMLASLVAVIFGISVFSSTVILRSRRQNELQRIELSKVALLDAIASASVEKLPQLYAEANFQINDAIPNLEASKANPADKLRWLCAAPASNSITLRPREFVDTLSTLSCAELLILVPKLSKSPQVHSPDFLDEIDDAMNQDISGVNTVRYASLRTEIDTDWVPSIGCVHNILRGLAQTSEEESNDWAKLLRNVRHSILDEAFKKVEDSTPDALRSVHLQSPSLRKIVWQWVNGDPPNMVRFLKKMPLSSLHFLHTVTADARPATIDLLKVESLRLKQRIQPKQAPRAISERLQDFLKQCGGVMGTHRGYIHSIARERMDDLISTLSENHLSLIAVQPYELKDRSLFCAVFEHSDEPCEVDWIVPLDEIENQMMQRREHGWELVSYWVNVHPKPTDAALLWRKGDWQPSQFITTDVNDSLRALSNKDTALIATSMFRQQFQFGEQTFDTGLITFRKGVPREESQRRFMQMHLGWNANEYHLMTTIKSEFIADHDEIIVIRKCESDSYQHQQASILEMGYEPLYVLAESGTGQLSSYWRKQSSTSRQSDYDNLAKMAIACWMLGPADLVLDALEPQTPPSVRTAVVENLASFSQNSHAILDLLRSETTPCQLQGLLLALAESKHFEVEPSRKVLQEKLRWCWMHPDSGVHYAADYVQRLKFLDENSSIVRPDYQSKYGYDPAKDRKWFYGAFGLPFVIIEEGTEGVYGLDERLPWGVDIDRHLEKSQHRFAICAVEIPDYLMQHFYAETHPSIGDVSYDYIKPPNGPAAGYPLVAMLQFCRWLSEIEGIPQDRIGLPEASKIQKGLRLSTSVWSRDGYRLPTNVEWEIAFRAGTTTRHFLGDSFDYMQNYCWDSYNCEQSPKPIATRKPNLWGMFDIAGNVYDAVLGDDRISYGDRLQIWGEKCLDDETVLDIRGGSFLSSRLYSAAGSHHHTSAWGDINAGFRIVRNLPDEP